MAEGDVRYQFTLAKRKFGYTGSCRAERKTRTPDKRMMQVVYFEGPDSLDSYTALVSAEDYPEFKCHHQIVSAVATVWEGIEYWETHPYAAQPRKCWRPGRGWANRVIRGRLCRLKAREARQEARRQARLTKSVTYTRETPC